MEEKKGLQTRSNVALSSILRREQDTIPAIPSEEQLRLIHEKGLSLTKSGKVLNVSAATVARYWDSMGLKPNFGWGGSRNGKLSEEQLTEVHKKGISLREAAQKLHVSQPTISRGWKRLGLKPHLPARPSEKQFRAIHKKGLSIAESGKALGVSSASVFQNWRKLGLKSNFSRGGFRHKEQLQNLPD